MNDERLAELKEKYKDRNLLEELAWGVYYDHSGYTSKQNGEFLNWLCLMAYKTIKDVRPQGEWIFIQYDGNPKIGNWHCSECRQIAPVNIIGYSEKTRFCPYCGASMKPKTCTNCETFGETCGDCEVGDDD